MVDREGNFIKYHGYTVICKVSPESKGYKKLVALESFINKTKTLRKYMVPTPSSSYHMTITGIDNHDPAVLKKIKEACNSFPTRVEVIIKDVYFGATPGIILETGPGVVTFRNRIRTMENPLASREKYSYHLTFGYNFKPIDPEDYEEYAEDVTLLKRYIFSIFPTSDFHLKLVRPALCEFEDMTKFSNV